MSGRGIQWEKVCNNSRDKLQQDGIIHWMRMHPPILKIGPGRKTNKGSFLAVRTGKGPPDWIVLADGMSILGDDKDSKGKRWSTWNVKKHQAVAFDRHEAQKGVSCVLLRMHDRSRWVIPWAMLRPFWEARATLGLDDLNEMGALQWVQKEPDNPNYDWLTPLLEWIDTKEWCLNQRRRMTRRKMNQAK
jgi:penicillin-binding protein-related factor A (putative recombinase)